MYAESSGKCLSQFYHTLWKMILYAYLDINDFCGYHTVVNLWIGAHRKIRIFMPYDFMYQQVTRLIFNHFNFIN